MALLFEDLKPLRLYSSDRQIYVPFNSSDKKNGALMFLATPNLESSYKAMQLPYMINKNIYQSYYLEKDCTFVINHENCLVKEIDNEFVNIMETVDKIGDTKVYTNLSLEDNQKPDRTFIDIDRNTQYIKLMTNETEDPSKRAIAISNIDDNTYITADLHLFNAKDGYNKSYVDNIIRKINIKTRPTDWLILCGDIVDCEDRDKDIHGWKYFLSSLKVNNVVLVLGNNDRLSIDDYYSLGIKYVCARLDVGNYTFTHYPETVEDGKLNFCGHLHSASNYWNVDPRNCINVGYANRKNGLMIYTIGEFKQNRLDGLYSDNTMVYHDMNELLAGITENLIIDRNDIELNVDKWGSDKFHNILYVTGFSGSGKSVLSKKKSNNNYIIISLDHLYNGTLNEENCPIANNIINKFPEYKKYSEVKLRGGSPVPYQVTTMMNNIMSYIIYRSEQDFGKVRYIIEGIQLYRYIPPEFVYGRPIIIKGTSALHSAIRRLNRQGGFTTSDTYKGVFDYFKWYGSDNTKLNTWANKQRKASYVESCQLLREESNYNPGRLIGEDARITPLGLQTKDTITVFNENLDEEILYEATKTNNATLKKLLYAERIKNTQEINTLYADVKAKLPFIKYTRYSYKLYGGKNIIVDMSYYNKAFFKNNYFKLKKGCELYLDFLTRFTEDARLADLGYTSKTIMIPISDWSDGTNPIWDFKSNINPISAIYYLMYSKDFERLKSLFGKYNVLFYDDNGYFTVDFNNINQTGITKFKTFLITIMNKEKIEEDNDEINIHDDSTKAIVTDIIDRIENTQHIKINYITGEDNDISKTQLDDKIQKSSEHFEKEGSPKTKLEIERDKKKKELVDRIETVASRSNSTQDALEDLDQDETIKQLLIDLAAEEDNNVKINAARASRMVQLNDNFHKKTINNKSVDYLLNTYNTSGSKELKETSLPINSINDEWQHLKFMNINKEYDLHSDIVAILDSFSSKTRPVSVRDINVENTTTSEDLKETWTVNMEDANGQRFTLKFDVPKFKSGSLLRLRGNDKALGGQLMNLPIIKTDPDVCQITSNYNKIFIRLYGSTTGKSYEIIDRIIKTINKIDNKRIKIKPGDNRRICAKYEVPLDYLDMSSLYTTIEIITDEGDYIFYFNQDDLRKNYKVDDDKGIPCGVEVKTGKVIYATNIYSDTLLEYLAKVPEFKEVYNTTKPGVKYMYSKASILNTEIPVIVVMGYCEGMTTSLKKAGINFEITDKKRKSYVLEAEGEENSLYSKPFDTIKFFDGYLNYELNYTSSLLMNGLKECNTEDYSIKEINIKAMWVDFLEGFGGKIKADGLDNFYDLMVDPITKNICIEYDLPYDFCEMLAYSNMLLADNKYNRHVDLTGNRYRYAEIVAGHVYKNLATSYASYNIMSKRSSKATMTIKQSAIIDSILLENTLTDSSTISDICYVESSNAVSFKGLSGMNSERSYGLDKRTYDKSMVNLLAMSTGFAATVGVNRTTTIDMNVKGTRGLIKTTENTDDMNDVNTLSITEALTPFGTVSDDPFRTAMTFVQTSKHSMRVAKGSPNLVTNGADDAICYMAPDVFSYKSKGEGKVIEKTNDYLVIEYKDGNHEFVDLREKVYKNSDGGFFVTVKLDTDLKEGNKVKEQQVVAYDKLSYTTQIGYDDNPTMNNGMLTKIAICTTDEGYEDSGIMSDWLSEAMASEIVVEKEVTLPKNTNIYNIVKKGQKIQEGEPLIIFQNAFDDADVNILLKTLTDDEDVISDIGRIPINSKITGTVQDIVIYRTVEKDELSSSLKKLVNEYESGIEKTRKVIQKYNPEQALEYDSNYKLEATGKLKDAADGVKIVFYLKYYDKMKVGDKTVMNSALKSVMKDIFPKGKEPTSEYRPDEPIEAFLAMSSVNKRMVASVFRNGLINKVMIELDRQVKEMNGIKWKYLRDM